MLLAFRKTSRIFTNLWGKIDPNETFGPKLKLSPNFWDEKCIFDNSKKMFMI